MAVTECPKIFQVQCIWGRIFVSLEKIFGPPYHSNGTKIHLDAALNLHISLRQTHLKITANKLWGVERNYAIGK